MGLTRGPILRRAAAALVLVLTLPGLTACGRITRFFDDLFSFEAPAGRGGDPLRGDDNDLFRRRFVQSYPAFQGLVTYLDGMSPRLEAMAVAVERGDLGRHAGDPAFLTCFLGRAAAPIVAGGSLGPGAGALGRQREANAAIRQIAAGDSARGVDALRRLDGTGLSFATLKLSLLHLDGRAVPFSLQLAYWYMDKAARQGCSVAQAALGYMHRDGLGTPIDPLRAYTWFTVASGLGDQAATAERRRAGEGLTIEQMRDGELRAQAFRAGLQR